MTDRQLTGQAADAIWKWIIDDGIKPHAAIIAPIIMGGDVAVVVFNLLPEQHDAASSLGWDGVAPVFRLSSGMRRRFADSLESMGDTLAAKWLRAKRNGRIFAMVESGTFLFNFDAVSKTYALEPGSNDPANWPSGGPE